jgi:hypothetical protein
LESHLSKRIQVTDKGTYEITIPHKEKPRIEQSKDDMLGPFLIALADSLYLKRPCPGSRYASLFKKSQVDPGYI